MQRDRAISAETGRRCPAADQVRRLIAYLVASWLRVSIRWPAAAAFLGGNPMATAAEHLDCAVQRARQYPGAGDACIAAPGALA